MPKLVLLTGGNLGDIETNIYSVKKHIADRIGNILRESSVYRSKAWGFDSSDTFLNQALIVDTSLDPYSVLDEIHTIEKHFGRERFEKKVGYESRTMDIDILFYDNEIIDSETLKIPHPLIQEREFVLTPLTEIMPLYRHPTLNMLIYEINFQKNAENSNNIDYICKP